MRSMVWNWWLSVAQTRLEPPYLVLVVMTRWHQDDLLGRLLSTDHEGDPSDWEVLSLPAVAEADDPMGRERGEPLISPIIDETPEQAVERWNNTKKNVGTYVFSAMYQQKPAPEQGAIFNSGWWRFWTWNPANVQSDGKVVLLDPASLTGGHWIDSWDCSFKGLTDSDFVVGQRWVRYLANRYLVWSQRGRWSFTQCLAKMRVWGRTDDPVLSPYGNHVHERIVEDTANGPAIIETLREEIPGLIPIGKKFSKEAYARAITPECESGNVFLPHPSDPGNEWVKDLISELTDFPHGADDDQVDTLSQSLARLRTPGDGRISVPGQLASAKPALGITRDLAGAARSDSARRRSPGLIRPRIPGR
jgi:predicted phage terminase large subunit-like protein